MTDADKWNEQHRVNLRTDRSMADHGRRIGALERKLVLVTALAAAVGSLLGRWLPFAN